VAWGDCEKAYAQNLKIVTVIVTMVLFSWHRWRFSVAVTALVLSATLLYTSIQVSAEMD